MCHFYDPGPYAQGHAVFVAFSSSEVIKLTTLRDDKKEKEKEVRL